MPFTNIVRDYLENLENILTQTFASGEQTPELSYRPILNNFFEDIAHDISEDIRIIFEPKNQLRSGRPDWRFHNARTLGVYGYIEAKGLDLNREINLNEYEEQVRKYLTLGHRVILTDGIEFVFFDPQNPTPTRISLVPKPIDTAQLLRVQPSLLLDNQFKSFFRDERPRQCTEDALITEAAKRAALISSSILDLAGLHEEAATNEDERRTIAVLNQLKTIVELHHDIGLQDEKYFADFVAEVLVFGLIYAHRVVRNEGDLPQERYIKIKKFWSDVIYGDYADHLKPFQAVVDLLGDGLDSLSDLGTWYDDCALMLAYIQLDETQIESPDYHKLFESFLAVLDPKTRFDYGAFYTPHELAKYTVNLVYDIINTQYKTINLFDQNNKFIDPCCGTGTFLEQILEKSQSVCALPKIIGFEILPAPYALAHYRISMLTRDHGYPESISIILTNTLSDELEQREQRVVTSNLIEEEQSKARELARPPLTLIIGNPPSSDSLTRTEGEYFSVIQQLLDDFRPPLNERTNRQNTQKQIQNEHIKFLRWACNKLMQSKPGMLAFILPSSFAEQTSYKYARKWILDHFENIWLLDIDKDGRSGIRTSSLFNTLQGRLLIVAFTGTNGNRPRTQEYLYKSIAGETRESKINWFEKNRNTGEFVSDFEVFHIDEQSWSFRPSTTYDKSLYNKFWPLYPAKLEPEIGEPYVFERQCSGVKIAPSALLVHQNSGMLKRKLRDIANEEISENEIIARWFAGQDRPPNRRKFSTAVRRSIGQSLHSNQINIKNYAFRPFLNMKALISDSVFQSLVQTEGSGTRGRPELRSAFEKVETIGISVAPAPKDIDGNLNRFVSFCWSLPDNDLSSRGNGRVFCNYFPENKKRRDWDSTPVNNINPHLLSWLSQYGLTSDDIVFYTYGVLCSNAYLDSFEGALFTVLDRVQRPRIPVPESADLFKTIKSLGQRLAELEKPNYSVNQDLRDVLIETLQPSFGTPFRFSTFELNADEEMLSLYDQNRTLVVELHPIPKELLNFRISGYNVLQQWLKFHTWTYTRTQFSLSDFNEMLDLFYKLNEQINIIDDLDIEVNKLIVGQERLLESTTTFS